MVKIAKKWLKCRKRAYFVMHELHFIVIRKIKFWAVLKVLKIWLQVVKMAKMAFSVTIRFFYQGIIQTKAKVGIQF